MHQPGYLSFLQVPKFPWAGSLILGLFVFNPRKARVVVFTLPCAMSLSTEGVGPQCPEGKCGRNEAGQLGARGMGQRWLLENAVMAPGQCKKTGVREKLCKTDQMEDISAWRRFMAILEQGSGVLIYWWHNQVSGSVSLQWGQAEYSAT